MYNIQSNSTSEYTILDCSELEFQIAFILWTEEAHETAI